LKEELKETQHEIDMQWLYELSLLHIIDRIKEDN